MKAIKDEVLIIGGGPVGLTAGLNLLRYGVKCRILEKMTIEPTSSKGLMLTPASMQVFDQLSIAQSLIRKGAIVSNANLYWESHRLYKLAFQDINSKFNYLFFLPQCETEKTMRKSFIDMGGVFEQGKELIDILPQEDQSSIVTIKDTSGALEFLRYHYVVAADGSRSQVAKMLKIDSDEQYPDFMHFLLGDFVVKWDGGDLTESHYFINEESYMIVLPLKPGYHRVFFKGQGLLEEGWKPTLAWYQEVASKASPPGFELSDPIWLSAVRHHAKVRKEFSIGNTFLIGDAAHSFSPMGGQGMNTGIQDAFNLSWKLAYVVKGWANAKLLGTYHEERYSVAMQTTESVMANTRIICREDKSLDGALGHMLPKKENVNFLRQQLPMIMSGLSHFYGTKKTQTDNETKDWTGHMVPPVTLKDKISVIYHKTKHTMLVFCDDALNQKNIKALNKLGERYKAIDIRYVGHIEINNKEISSLPNDISIATKNAFGLQEGIIIIRPDQYIAHQLPLHEIDAIDYFLSPVLKVSKDLSVATI
jgi:2-polyprenyl-6-methoxyphenol hydroxylase-like FAD-dependent oxidoreductase